MRGPLALCNPLSWDLFRWRKGKHGKRGGGMNHPFSSKFQWELAHDTFLSQLQCGNSSEEWMWLLSSCWRRVVVPLKQQRPEHRMFKLSSPSRYIHISKGLSAACGGNAWSPCKGIVLMHDSAFAFHHRKDPSDWGDSGGHILFEKACLRDVRVRHPHQPSTCALLSKFDSLPCGFQENAGKRPNPLPP